MDTQAILLPGGVLPGSLAYPDLVTELGPDIDARPKELEIYAGDDVPEAWGLDSEVDGIERFAADAGFDRFHVVGYSAGGACALAYCAAHPDRVLSLTLNEPAWGGNDGWTDDERANWRRIDEIMTLPPDEMLPAFMRNYLRDGVEPPPAPDGPPPPWFAKRPAGLRALTAAFKAYDLDVEALRTFHGPVLYAIGAKTNPVAVEPLAERLGTVFRNFTREIYEDRHHFDPPHRAEPARVAASLRRLWQCTAAVD